MNKSLNAALVLLCLFIFGLGVLPGFESCSFALFALMLIGCFYKFADVFLLGLVCGLALFLSKAQIFRGLLFPPLPLAISLAAGFVAGKALPFARGAFDWIEAGVLERRQAALVGGIAALSAISLVCWYELAQPDVKDLAQLIPHTGMAVLIVAGFLFSVFNAVCEEFLWRGVVFAALERALLPAAAVIAFQAGSFGMAHLPRFGEVKEFC